MVITSVEPFSRCRIGRRMNKIAFMKRELLRLNILKRVRVLTRGNQ